MDLNTILIFVLAAVAVAGIAWAVVLPYMTGEIRAEKRHKRIALQPSSATVNRTVRDASVRRNQVAETLKELEERQKRRKNLPIAVRIEQAGLSISKRQFVIYSAIAGVLSALVLFAMSGNLLVTVLGLFIGSVGLPRWIIAYLRSKRQKAFLQEFPNAIDVIVRGIKAGLPLADSMRTVAQEGQEPVKTEFLKITETQAVGIPLGEACLELYENTGLTEANFFGIVVSIQQKTGGSLSDSLSNLSRVLRERKKMKAKIQAMSMEAKASATIIGALPVIVAVLVWLSSPNYIELLWTHEVGRVMLAGCAVWMFCGIMVMKKMINFDI